MVGRISGQRRLRRVARMPAVGGEEGRQQQFGRPPAAQPPRRLPPCDSPEPAARRTLGLVAGRAAPDREERLLQHVLDLGGGQHAAQPGGQPRRMPGEQLAQRGVVAAGHGSDQRIVVHRFSIACRRRPVRASGEISLGGVAGRLIELGWRAGLLSWGGGRAY